MKRWYMTPKRFLGNLESKGQSVQIRLTVGVSKKGVVKVVVDALPYDASTMFISDAVHDQIGEFKFAQFSLSARSRDGSTFLSESAIVTSLKLHASVTESLTMTPVLLCSECKIAFNADAAEKSEVRVLLSGLECLRVYVADSPIGTVSLSGPMTLRPSQRNDVTGYLLISSPPALKNLSSWRGDVDGLFQHVRAIMSFARGARLRAPITEVVQNGRVELTVRYRNDEGDARTSGVFTTFTYERIFRQAVKSYFFENPRAKNIYIAIEWFTMSHQYGEAKLTSAMTVLENMLTSNLTRSDVAVRRDKQAKIVRAAMIDAARIVLTEFGAPEAALEMEVAIIRDKLEEINRRPLKDKIYILANRWGVPMDGISDEDLSRAKRARDHVVHRGQYLAASEDQHMMRNVRLARELVVRFILTALEYEGEYASPLTGETNRVFKALTPQLN